MQIMGQVKQFRVPPNRRLRKYLSAIALMLKCVPPNRRLRKAYRRPFVPIVCVPPNRRLRNFRCGHRHLL